MTVNWQTGDGDRKGEAGPNRMEVLGAATAGIVHDLNNELTLVLNHLALGGTEPGHLEDARAAAARCAALTGSLLSFCRGEKPVPGKVDAANFLREFARGKRLPAAVDLHVEAPDGLPAIVGHTGSLRRILDNLILNACQAMNNSGTIVLLATECRIWVHDSGPGIPEEHLSAVFRPFFTTKKGSGTGLGLAVVRELMQQQGGNVSVTSKVGLGTIFELRFKSY